MSTQLQLDAAVDLLSWHAVSQGSVRWRLADLGVEVEGAGIARTSGPPATARRVWESYADPINAESRRLKIQAELLVATMCTETRGKADAIRFEPGYVSDEQTPHKISPGVMQTLISTASDTLRMSVTRAWLLDAPNSIRAGAQYIADQARKTRLDPPLVAAAYNAGGLYQQGGAQNRWRLRQYPIGTGKHCDRFVEFYNDAVDVIANHSTRAILRHQDYLRSA